MSGIHTHGASIILSAVFGIAHAAAPPAGRPMEGVKVVRDIQYAKGGDRPLLLDLYLPEKASGPLPLVIWVHGGAWRAGSRANPPALFLLRHGYAVASISYRFSQEAVFPAQIEDCKAAVRFLRSRANQYGIDAERFGAWGASAGGHLVALLGTAGDVKEFDKGDNLEFSSRVQAVCDFFGPTDFLAMGRNDLDHNAPNSPESQLIGGPIQQNRDKCARANPITYVSPDDPPFLIMHGDKDRLVPINQSELLHAALRKAGVDSTFRIVEGKGHGFGGPEIQQTVLEFFDKHLKKR